MSPLKSPRTVTWLELTVDCERGSAVRLSDFFSDAGAVSVSLSDASDEILIEQDAGRGPLWAATRVRGLFNQDAELERLKRELKAAGFGAPEVACIDDQEWSQVWRQHVRPQRYGGRLLVLPTFADAADQGGACVRLDPGLAFGTGSHATTALCLEWLAQCELEGLDVIDYGCGSGILAIAAVKLGAQSARCVDNDPTALDTARDNARSNQVEERLSFYLPEEMPPHPADVLVANILALPLTRLAETLANLLRDGGRIALSGILKDQEDAVSGAYKGYIEFEAARYRNGWARLSGRRLPAVARSD